MFDTTKILCVEWPCMANIDINLRPVAFSYAYMLTIVKRKDGKSTNQIVHIVYVKCAFITLKQYQLLIFMGK